MTYSTYERPSIKSSPKLIDNDITMCTFQSQLRLSYRVETKFVYFMFNHELYAILSEYSSHAHWMYKYNKAYKFYDLFLILMSPDYSPEAPDKKMRSSDARLRLVFSNVSQEHVFILFGEPDGEIGYQLLVKVDMGITGKKPGLEYEREIDKQFCFDTVFHKQCLYTFYKDHYEVYNISTDNFQDYLHEQGGMEINAFCQFQEQLYSLEIDATDKKMKLYYLNEKDCCFELLFEQPFELVAISAQGVCTSSEMHFIVDLDHEEVFDPDQDEDDLEVHFVCKTLLYHFDPNTKGLNLWKEIDSRYYGRYLLVPFDLYE